MGFAMTGAGLHSKTATVTTAAAVIVAAPTDGNARATSLGVLVKSLSSNAGTIYIGGSDVTTSNGLPLLASESVYVPVDDPSRIYAVGSAGSQDLRILY